MKTEERHQLQKNELADWLGEHAASIQPYLKTLIGVAILVLVGFLALNVMRGQNEGRNQAAWSGFFEAQVMNDPDAAKEVARRFPNTQAAAWAWQWAGDFELAESSSLAFTDRAEYREGLEASQEAYEAALNANPPTLIEQRARLGLAQVYEGLDELEKAQETYQQIVTRWPATAASQKASERIAFLEYPETKQFSRWFAQQKPSQQVPQPPSGISGPSALDDLPTDSELSLPDESALQGARQNAPFDAMTPPDAQPADTGDDDAEMVEEDSIYDDPPESETAAASDDADMTETVVEAEEVETESANPLRGSETKQDDPPTPPAAAEDASSTQEEPAPTATGSEGESEDADTDDADTDDADTDDADTDDGKNEGDG